jgi:hypothetical protein
MKEENWKERRKKINKLKKGKVLFSMHFHNIYRPKENEKQRMKEIHVNMRLYLNNQRMEIERK